MDETTLTSSDMRHRGTSPSPGETTAPPASSAAAPVPTYTLSTPPTSSSSTAPRVRYFCRTQRPAYGTVAPPNQHRSAARPKRARARLSTQLPVTIQDAVAAAPLEPSPVAQSSVVEVPCDAHQLDTPREVWLVCSWTVEVPSVNGCLGNTVNSALKSMQARYSHVELLFRFSDDTWQALKTSLSNGTVLIDAEPSHYRNERLWKCFRFRLSEQELADFYRAAVPYKGAKFNMAAILVYSPWIFAVFRYVCCCFACCFGVAFEEDSGRYYCTQIVLLVLKKLRPAKYLDIDSSSIVPDVLIRRLLDDSLIAASPFPRETSRINLRGDNNV